MRIAIVGPSPIPYTRGGIENFLAALYRAINDYTDHSAELIKVPVRENNVVNLLKAYSKFSLVNLDHFDLIITSKYPSWMIKHRNHVLYLGHRLRGLYDTYPFDPSNESFLRSSPFKFPGPWIRRIIHYLDKKAFDPKVISHVFAFSKTVSARLEYFHPEMPPSLAYCSTSHEKYFCNGNDYFFTVSRLDAPKRIDILIRAYRQCESKFPFIIAGTGPQEGYLKALAQGDSRIKFAGSVSEEELLRLYAGSLAVLYIPYQEDYGLITLEAMKSSKPVVTSTDSGGPLEFVCHGENGLITEPTEESLAKQIMLLADSPEKAFEMGKHALKTVAEITWENAVKTLLNPYEFWPSSGPLSGLRRRIVVLVPYPVFPARSGGSRRIAALYSEVAKVFNVYLLTVGRADQPYKNFKLAPNLYEIRIPISAAHAHKQWAQEKALNQAVSDVMLDSLIHLTPNYVRAVQHFLECSDVAVSAQPYLHRLLHKTERCKVIVHESQNFELALKRKNLGQTAAARKLIDEVQSIEKYTMQNSDLLLCTSMNEGSQMAAHYKNNCAMAAVPNGVDIDEVTPVSSEEKRIARSKLKLDDRPAVLFMGAWHPPNLESFRFVLDNLAPALPGMVFIVVGSVKTQYEVRVGQLDLPENVIAMGEVDDETRLLVLQAVDLGINPMFSGSGTNLKILEYFAAGIPVVSTMLGIRGLDVSNEEHVCIAEAEEFADKCKRLMDSPDMIQAIVMNARAKVESTFSWKIIAQSYLKAVGSLIQVPTMNVSVSENDCFPWGWYPPEVWEKGFEDRNIYARWSQPDAQLRVPKQKGDAKISFLVKSGPRPLKLKIYEDGCIRFDQTLNEKWERVVITCPEQYARDQHTLQLVCESWSPSEFNSSDTRHLGIAITDLQIESSL